MNTFIHQNGRLTNNLLTMDEKDIGSKLLRKFYANDCGKSVRAYCACWHYATEACTIRMFI